MPKLVQVSLANVDAYRTVRMQALEHDPTAFGSTYAAELQMTAEDWVRRVTAWDGKAEYGIWRLMPSRPAG